MILYQIADQLLATSHMPGNKIQIENGSYLQLLYGLFVWLYLVLPIAACSLPTIQVYKEIEREISQLGDERPMQ